jgi:hypothetical protein
MRSMLTAVLIGAAPFSAALAGTPALAADSQRPDKVSFYFAAHQDDWQLFMNPSAFEDVIDGAAKTVFIHITAGDAGIGTGTRGRKHPFYLARDNGAETAIRFMADADDIPASKTVSYQSFYGHPVYRISYRNTVSYFLRVPDGNPSGTGYADTGYQSLRRLFEGAAKTISAVDGSTSYQGWGDVVATVREIVDFERGRAALTQINVAELDPRINPNDHSDHLMTAKAALDAVAGLGCVRRVHYVNYASSKLRENLKPEQRDRESSVFAVTLAGVLALDHGTAWHHYARSYVGRNYFRVEEPTARCNAATMESAAAKRRKR